MQPNLRQSLTSVPRSFTVQVAVDAPTAGRFLTGPTISMIVSSDMAWSDSSTCFPVSGLRLGQFVISRRAETQTRRVLNVRRNDRPHYRCGRRLRLLGFHYLRRSISSETSI